MIHFVHCTSGIKERCGRTFKREIHKQGDVFNALPTFRQFRKDKEPLPTTSTPGTNALDANSK